jgi:thioredoxin-dependent peroxiredoxin
MTTSVRVGDRAPDFTLPSTSGEEVTLSSFLGKKTVVLFFYPKDDSPGCTAEACDFRDGHGRFLKAGAEVLGVSSDSVDSHKKFAAKHGLPMTLLSDIGGKVRAKFGIKSTLGFIPGRVTFVIDRRGVVQYVYDSQLLVGRHVQQALETVEKLEKDARATASAAAVSP